MIVKCYGTAFLSVVYNVDIDECAVGMTQCEQVCVNQIGSFSCGCNIGYEVVSDAPHSCRGKVMTCNKV